MPVLKAAIDMLGERNIVRGEVQLVSTLLSSGTRSTPLISALNLRPIRSKRLVPCSRRLSLLSW